ncbi:MAG: hypothetical protein R3325_15135 [Thermoanaerobaculia bacterium]|nr:hypothetical protein [Thermoanaerobaculia bacterium]
MRSLAGGLALLLLPVAAPAAPAAECERGWTFPVPFFQSVAWSPDGSRLAFAAVTESWEEGYALFLVDRDGTNLRRLPTGPALYPVFSPDGSRLAYMSRGENRDLHLLDLATGEISRLTHHPASDGYPSFSPDGSQIVFHSDRDGDYEIYVMDLAAGSTPRRLTDHPADDYNPVWSPAGGQIVFESDRDEVEGDEIYLVDADGTALRQVGVGVFPTWSPDGSRLLVAADGLEWRAVDGSGGGRLLEDAVYGAWSPDGRSVAAAAVELDEECVDHHSLVLLDARDGARLGRLYPGPAAPGGGEPPPPAERR